MKKVSLTVSLFILLGLFVSACSPTTTTPVSTTPSAPVQATLQPSPTTAPTATAQPGKLLLIGQPGASTQPVQDTLSELIAGSGLQMEVRPELQAADLTPEVKVVVLLSAPANLAELIAAAPQTQFVAFSTVDLPAAANLTVIRWRGEMQAFVAGFISVLVNDDYRAGGLLPADGPLGGSLQDAFVNGGSYFCGVCAPGWPLGMKYPQVKALPAASDGATWQASAAELFDNQKVVVYYISPEAARDEVFTYLQGRVQFDRTVLVVGTQAPPEALAGQWVATVGFDSLPALRQAMPDVLAGKGGAVLDAPLVVSNVNQNLLGAGRMRLVTDLIDEIKAGKVFPFSLPVQ